MMIVGQAATIAYIVNSAFILRVGPSHLLGAFGCLIGLVIIRAALAPLREYVGFKSGAVVRTVIRKKLWHKMSQLGPVALKQRGDAAALSHNVVEQVESLQNFFAQYLPQTVVAIMVPISILCIVFPLSWLAGTILLVTAPLIPIFMALVGMGAASLNRKHFVVLGRMSQNFLDILHGISTLKLFYASRQACQQVEAASEAYRHTTMKVLKVAFLSSGVLELFASISIALLATYLGLSFLGYIHFGYAGPHLTLAVGLFILLLAPEFYFPLRELGAHYHARAEAIGASEEILVILEGNQASHQQGARQKVRQNFSGSSVGGKNIHLHNVRYCYPNRQMPALMDINLEIRQGEYIAFVGPSGASKSTLLHLLAGFITPSAGSMSISQYGFNAADAEEWRQNFTWLGQNPRLFHGTIAENLRIACPNASDQVLYEALEKSYMAECVLALPAGLDTLVTDGQSGLSGGQLQRLALARAYLKSAPVLLLDEPTAHLDNHSEHLVMQSLASVSQHRTLIMLTHHFQCLSAVDRIIVLDSGKIVQQGTFKDLSQQSGLFQALMVEADYV